MAVLLAQALSKQSLCFVQVGSSARGVATNGINRFKRTRGSDAGDPAKVKLVSQVHSLCVAQAFPTNPKPVGLLLLSEPLQAVCANFATPVVKWKFSFLTFDGS